MAYWTDFRQKSTDVNDLTGVPPHDRELGLLVSYQRQDAFGGVAIFRRNALADFNGTRILFETNPDTVPAILYFWVDDIDAARVELSAQGVAFTGEPHMIHKDEDGTFDNPGTEEWMAFFEDPAGNTLAIATRR